MILRGQNRKAVLLLGAGATRGAIRHVLVNNKRLRPPLNGDFFRVAETYARAHGAKSVESRRLQRLRRVFREDIPVPGMPTMEEAFGLLYLAGDFPEIYKRRRGRKPGAGQSQEIDDFLALAFGVLTELEGSPSTATEYDRLAANLTANDTIITLNYDTLLDSALWRHGWDPRVGYCLAGDPKKVRWKVNPAASPASASRVRLLKLHGSVNWFVRGSTSQLEAVFKKKPVRVTPPRRNGIAQHIRQIVPPLYGKAFKHEHWRKLWELAYASLREAEILAVVGCSLVDTDFHLRALVSRVAKWRKKQGTMFRALILVDNNLRVRRKWQRVLRGTTRDYRSIKGFEKFLSEEVGP